MKRNPVVSNIRERDENIRRKLLTARGEEIKRGCVHCWDAEHKATQCDKVVEVGERKKFLVTKGLCINCATRTHRASECPSTTSCQHCSKRHHSSIYLKRSNNPRNKRKLMTDTGVSDDGVFPVVVVKVNGVQCRALMWSSTELNLRSLNVFTVY